MCSTNFKLLRQTKGNLINVIFFRSQQSLSGAAVLISRPPVSKMLASPMAIAFYSYAQRYFISSKLKFSLENSVDRLTTPTEA